MTETVSKAVPAADPNAGTSKPVARAARAGGHQGRTRAHPGHPGPRPEGRDGAGRDRGARQRRPVARGLVRAPRRLLAAKKPAPQGAAVIDVVRDETVAERGAIVNALMHRVDPKLKLDDQAKQFAGYSLRELARERLEAKGIRTRGMSIVEICNRTFESGSDLPNIVLDAANKSLRQAYDAAPRTHEMWARQVDCAGLQEHQPDRALGSPVAPQGAAGRGDQARCGHGRQGDLPARDLRPHPRHQPRDDHQRRHAGLHPPAGARRALRLGPRGRHGVRDPHRERQPRRRRGALRDRDAREPLELVGRHQRDVAGGRPCRRCASRRAWRAARSTSTRAT
jgi:hypothetical protein